MLLLAGLMLNKYYFYTVHIFKNKIIAFVMLLVLATPLCYVASLTIQQLFVKIAMEKKLKTAALQHITLPINEVQWHDKDKEIIINGKLFDVENYTVTYGLATFKGLYDSVEDGINKKLNNFENKQIAPIYKLIVKFFSTPIFSTIVNNILFSYCEFLKKNYCNYVVLFIATPQPNEIIPPKLFFI